ncbi:hypothetical protein [Bdellovibrio sp. GT3]|uniref:hypothetical protein n=1 Tax=Bdellovibrio sp. GT3 TaxID=3136282 RepID=UPI0030F3344A
MRFGAALGLKLVTLSMVFTAPSYAHTETQYPKIEETNKIAHSLMTVLGQCPNRLWPDLKLQSMDILLINKEMTRQILVSPKSQTISTIPNEELPPHVFQTSYSRIPYQGREILYVDSQFGVFKPGLPSKALELAIHEGFHMVDQRSWAEEKARVRGTWVPLLVQPRIARAMLYKNLVLVAKSKGDVQVHLQNARYWYDEWLKADPTEKAMSTDQREGTARYVEAVAEVLKARGCSATEEEISKDIINSSLLNGHHAVGFRELDTEGYFVGGVASFILRSQYSAVDWQSRVAKGETPVEILLKDIAPLAETADSSLVAGINKELKKLNDRISEDLAPTRNLLKQEDVVFVSVPAAALKTSFSPKGFYLGRDEGLRYTPLAKELKFQFQNQQNSLLADPNSVFIRFQAGVPCELGWTFALKSADVIARAGVFEIKSELFSGRVEGVVMKDTSNRPWICVQP